MALCNLNEIEQHRNENTILLEVDSDRDVRFVIW